MAARSFPAYGSIVATGANACVLHYRENDAMLRDGELLLVDAACELDGYASDITRTWPVNGRYGGAQRELYAIVLAAQQAAIDATRAGARFTDPHDAAVRVLVEGMIDCKLIAGSVDGAIESGSFRRFYMHRAGHWLGMDVHDVGEYNGRRHGACWSRHGADRRTRHLRRRPTRTWPRMARHRHPHRGRRGGDRDGCEILTGGVPKTVAEIEALMQK